MVRGDGGGDGGGGGENKDISQKEGDKRLALCKAKDGSELQQQCSQRQALCMRVAGRVGMWMV